MRLYSLVIALVLLSAPEAFAQGFRSRQQQQASTQGKLDIKYRAWRPAFEGEISSDEAGFTGTDLDLNDALNLEDDSLFHDLTVSGDSLNLGDVRFNFWKGKMEGDVTPSTPFTWSGETFAAGARVHSEFEFASHGALWDFPVLNEALGSGMFEGGIDLGYRTISIDSQLSNGSVQGGGSVRGTAIIAGVHIFSQLASWLYLEADASVDLYDYSKGTDLKLLDYSFELLVNPLTDFFIGAGYRRVDLQADDEHHGSDSSRELDAVLEGFFVSVFYKF